MLVGGMRKKGDGTWKRSLCILVRALTGMRARYGWVWLASFGPGLELDVSSRAPSSKLYLCCCPVLVNVLSVYTMVATQCA